MMTSGRQSRPKASERHMIQQRTRPGIVRDAILAAMNASKGPMTVTEIRAAVEQSLGKTVASSSVRSYLNINTPGVFLRTDRGTYRLVRR